ncbi:hypothetical protein EBU71_06590 [bacterium]|nr:hypothetical protein [Candidatus Elulimicrobium humile]
MFNWFKNLRKKSDSKSIEQTISDMSIGQSLKLKFKDPRRLGLIDPSGTLTRRYDPEDLINRVLIGTLLTKKVVNNIVFIEIGCFKMRNGMRVERTYTLMLEEIEHLEEIK